MTADAEGGPLQERVLALDVLRGVAVGGILLANVLVFFGLFAMPEARVAALPTADADRVVAFLETVFVEGKFYSIFSLLFGIGFGMQLARSGDSVLPRFRRRLRILLAIGAIHAVFLWAGDILMLYALLGFTLPWFARKSDDQLLRWTVILLALPSALYLVAALVAVALGASGGGGGDEDMPARILGVFEAVGTGGVREAFTANLVLLAGRWAELFLTMRFPKVLGMFVLGLWVTRRGIVHALPAHQTLLRRWAVLGWSVGVPANLAGAWAVERWAYLPPSPGGLLGVVLQGLGFPMLALGYAATIALFVVTGDRLRGVAPMGRMALTNYLMHSLVFVLLSYGFGLGLWWRVGASAAVAIALAVVLLQVPLSAWWLSRYRFGPVEWLWRRLTYREAIALTRSRVASPA